MALESTPRSLLDGFRKQHKPVERKLVEAPPVSLQLISWLEETFPREQVMVNDTMMQQKLVVRRGMDIILDHLRSTHDRQSKGAIGVYDNSNPCPTR